jgi:hypothetical protein
MTNVTLISNKTHSDEVIFGVQVYHEMANWRILNYVPFTILVGFWLLTFVFVTIMYAIYYGKEAIEDYR